MHTLLKHPQSGSGATLGLTAKTSFLSRPWLAQCCLIGCEAGAGFGYRYQLWRREVLNQRQFARRFVRFLWLSMIPLAVGVAVARTDASPRELLHKVKDRLPKRPLRRPRQAAAEAFAGGEDTVEEAEEPAMPLTQERQQHNGKKLFWF